MMRKSMEELEFMEGYCDRLMKVCKKRNVNRLQLAEKADVPRAAMYKYADAERGISLFHAVKISRALGVSLDAMVGQKVKPPSCEYKLGDTGFLCGKCGFDAGDDIAGWEYCPGCGRTIFQRCKIDYI